MKLCVDMLLKFCMIIIDYVNSIFYFSFGCLFLFFSIRMDDCGFIFCSVNNYLNGCLLLNCIVINSSN